MAWFFLNEKLTSLDLIGFVIASVGVFIATRNSENLLIELLTNELLEEILAKLYTFSNDT